MVWSCFWAGGLGPLTFGFYWRKYESRIIYWRFMAVLYSMDSGIIEKRRQDVYLSGRYCYLSYRFMYKVMERIAFSGCYGKMTSPKSWSQPYWAWLEFGASSLVSFVDESILFIILKTFGGNFFPLGRALMLSLLPS